MNLLLGCSLSFLFPKESEKREFLLSLGLFIKKNLILSSSKITYKIKLKIVTLLEEESITFSQRKFIGVDTFWPDWPDWPNCNFFV